MSKLVDKTCKDTEWWTPLHIVVAVKMFFAEHFALTPHIPLDPATHPSNPTGAEEFYCSEGELKPWVDGTFVNPPYGKEIKTFVAKIAEEAHKGLTIVALLPASRGEQEYWQRDVFNDHLTALCLVRKRLRFRKPDGTEAKSNPYASVLYFYNAYWPDVAQVFSEEIGKCIEIQTVIGGTEWKSTD